VAYTYDVNSTYGFVVIRNASSKWTGADVLESGEEVAADDRVEPGYDRIFDLRFIHATVVTVVEMEQIVEQARLCRKDGLLGETSRAVLVGTDEDLRYAGDLYRRKADRPDALFNVVETMEEARRWLGIEASASEIGLAD
jgi:hypothetical protein